MVRENFVTRVSFAWREQYTCAIEEDGTEKKFPETRKNNGGQLMPI